MGKKHKLSFPGAQRRIATSRIEPGARKLSITKPDALPTPPYWFVETNGQLLQKLRSVANRFKSWLALSNASNVLHNNPSASYETKNFLINNKFVLLV